MIELVHDDIIDLVHPGELVLVGKGKESEYFVLLWIGDG